MPTLEELTALFDAAVEGLAVEFHKGPALLLTEEDLRCHLFSRLRNDENLSRLVPTADPEVLGAALHCDLRWFDATGKLLIQPDITILEPTNLSIVRSLAEDVPFPSKGAHFVGEALVAEIKFYRHKSTISEVWLDEVKADLEKMNTLIERHRTEGTRLVGVMVVFARYSRHVPVLEDLVQRYGREVRSLVRSGFDETT